MVFFSDARLEALVSIVQQAGGTLLGYWPGRAERNLEAQVVIKSDGSPVSSADIESNEILSSGIARLFPDDLIFSEESPVDLERLRTSSRTWIVDPLDGTAAFLAGRDDFAVLVALCESQRPNLGIMFFPARGELITAQLGVGAVSNGKPLRVSSIQGIRPGHVYIRNFDCLKPELQCASMDSSLALLKVANGDLDGAVIRMTTHREWDIAAPIVAITEAGGRVSDEQGRPIACGVGELSFRYFVASNGLNHEEVQALIPAK